MNRWFQAESSPAAQPRTEIGFEFETNYEVVQKSIKASRASIPGLVRVSSPATASADFSTSPALNITSQLTFNPPNGSVPIFGNPYISIYLGTVTTSSWQIFPIRGGSVTLGRFLVQAGYDLIGWDGVESQYAVLLQDTNGTSSQTITAQVQWQYIDSSMTKTDS